MGLLDFKNTLQQVKKDLLDKPKKQLLGLKENGNNTLNFKKEIKAICIDPGHGDNFNGTIDPGTSIKVGDVMFLEKDMVLPVALKLKEKLELSGYQTIITRNGDVAKKQQRFTWRLEKAAKSDLLISLHMGYFADSSLRGIQVIYFSGIITSENLADNLKYGQKSNMSDFSVEKLARQSKNSKSLAESILDSVNVLPNLQRNSLKGESHNILRNFEGIASVIVEMGVIGNADDRSVLLNDFETLANEIAIGITTFINEVV